MHNKISQPPDLRFQQILISSSCVHRQQQQHSNPQRERPKLLRNTSSYSSQKTAHNFHRNKKSLKILSMHLNNYKQEQNNLIRNKKKQQNVNAIFNNGVYLQQNKEIKDINKDGHHRKYSKDADLSNSFKRSQKESIGRSSSEQQNQKRQLIRQAVKVDKGFHQKISQLIDNLLMNIRIFNKVFETSKHKRSMLSKLYGWDPLFNPIFFPKYGQFYLEQFRPNITKNSIITELGLDKHTFSSQNIYNKLRLFLAELINKNMSHQQLQSKSQKSKLIQSSQKLRNSLTKINKQFATPNSKNSTNQNQQAASTMTNMSSSNKYLLSQVEKMRQTHNQMFSMKARIKNRADQIQKLARNTGYVRVNPFYIQEEKNVQRIQQFIQSVTK